MTRDCAGVDGDGCDVLGSCRCPRNVHVSGA